MPQDLFEKAVESISSESSKLVFLENMGPGKEYAKFLYKTAAVKGMTVSKKLLKLMTEVQYISENGAEDWINAPLNNAL